MRLEQGVWRDGSGWDKAPGSELGAEAQLVLVFGTTSVVEQGKWLAELKGAYPNARLFGCTTAGEICGTQIFEDSLVSTAIQFESTKLRLEEAGVEGPADSYEAGSQLGASLPHDGLRHVFVLSDGQKVNGSELVRGLLDKVPQGVQITGGLAGDGARFEKTFVISGDQPRQGAIGALGLYGERLQVGYGSLGGWDTFGPERNITRSEGNVLYELDGKPALELYKRYLGEHATGLPATGLLFPLSIRRANSERNLTRTILAVDEEAQSLTFAGDVPEGATTQLMKANFDRLVEGASGAAQSCYEAIGGSQPDLALLVSCVGRRLVLKQRTEDEVESVQEVLGEGTVMTGFYSYGEICPAAIDAGCELHNQTMTITTLSER